MEQAAGVLREVRAADADALGRPVVAGDLEPALHREREVELRDLVALRQVRVHVVLTVEFRVLGRPAVERDARGDRELDRAAVRVRERARQPEADLAGERVRRRAEPLRRTAAEHLGAGVELDLALDTDDRLVSHPDGHRKVGSEGAGTTCVPLITRLGFTTTLAPSTDTAYRSYVGGVTHGGSGT